MCNIWIYARNMSLFCRQLSIQKNIAVQTIHGGFHWNLCSTQTLSQGSQRIHIYDNLQGGSSVKTAADSKSSEVADKTQILPGTQEKR